MRLLIAVKARRDAHLSCVSVSRRGTHGLCQPVRKTIPLSKVGRPCCSEAGPSQFDPEPPPTCRLRAASFYARRSGAHPREGRGYRPAAAWPVRDADSPLEGTGFELSVPREIGFISGPCRSSGDLSSGELRAPIGEAGCSTRIDHRIQFDRIHTFEHRPSETSPAHTVAGTKVTLIGRGGSMSGGNSVYFLKEL